MYVPLSSSDNTNGISIGEPGLLGYMYGDVRTWQLHGQNLYLFSSAYIFTISQKV